jgi:predicted alpha/beta-hydrolase family hydrolase
VILVRALVIAAALGLGWSAQAQPILEAPPSLSGAGRASYANFLLMNVPRAIAISPTGAYGWDASAASLGGARAKALRLCAEQGGKSCTIYAEDLQVVRSPAALPTVSGPLIATSRFAFMPDARFFWRGPQSAAGVVVWGHGYSGADERDLQPPPVVRAFNNAGFDVVRFERDPSADYPEWARSWLRDGLAELRRRGYRSIVAGGQSRGANDALFALSRNGLADGIIALSPGSYGVAFSAEFSRSIHEAASPTTRVVFVQFEHDEYAGSDLADRAALVQDMRPHVGGLLVIDRPAGFDGHLSGTTGRFAIEFGPCIYRFIVGQPASCRD